MIIIDGFLFTIGAVIALIVLLCLCICLFAKEKPPTLADVLRERRLSRK